MSTSCIPIVEEEPMTVVDLDESSSIRPDHEHAHDVENPLTPSVSSITPSSTGTHGGLLPPKKFFFVVKRQVLPAAKAIRAMKRSDSSNRLGLGGTHRSLPGMTPTALHPTTISDAHRR
jgi:hypothetical protein